MKTSVPDRMTLVLEGDIYPYVRTTVRQKFVDKYYKLYAASTDAIRFKVAEYMRQMRYDPYPLGTPLRMGIVLMVRKGLHKRDLSNQVKAIEDALQGYAFANDAWFDQGYEERFLGGEDRCVVIIEPAPDEWGIVERAQWVQDVLNISANILFREGGG